MVDEGFMSKARLNLQLQEWVREEQIETRKEGAAHAWNWEVGGECSVLAARRTALLKGPEG